jgi:hypothetical protein
MQPQRMILPIPMAGGVDRRSDRRHVKPPKCLALENVRFTGPGTIQKRFGCDALGTTYSSVSGTTRSTAAIAGGHSLFAAGDRLYTMAAHRLLSWDDTTDTWALHGLMPLVKATLSEIVSPIALPVQNASVARTTDGLVGVAGGTTDTHITLAILDEITGTRYSFSLTGANLGAPKVVALGTNLLVFWTDAAGSHNLKMRVFTRAALPTTATTALSSPTATVVATGLKDTGVSSFGNAFYELADYDATKVLLAYVTPANDIAYAYCDATGTLTSAGTLTPAAAPIGLSIAVSADRTLWSVAWTETATNDLKARIYNSSMVAQIAATLVETASGIVQQLASVWVSATKVHLVWGIGSRNIRHGSIDTAAAVAAATLFFNAAIVSRPWMHDGAAYQAFTTSGGTPVSHRLVAIVRLGAPAGAAVTAPGDNQVATLVATMLHGESMPTVTLGAFMSSHVAAGAGAGEVLVPLLVIPPGGINTSFTGDVAIRLATLTFQGSVTLGQAQAALDDAAHVPAGVTWTIDAEGAYETGFAMPGPQDVSFTKSNGAGNLTPNATYQYRLFWEWLNARGELEQSSATNFAVTMGATDDTLVIDIDTLPFTNRCARLGLRDVGIGVYRADPGSATYRRVSSTRFAASSGANGYTLNDPTVQTVQFTDHLANGANPAGSSGPLIDYLSEGEIDNSGPPACSVATTCAGRTYLSGFAHNGDLIWFSKQRLLDIPMSFSDLNTILVQGGAGPITALGALGDTLVVFRRRQLYLVGGEGPGNTGVGGSFTPARLMSEEVGCTNPASVVNGPAGLYFQASDGIYLLDNAGALTFVGADVQDLTDGATITSAVLVDTARELRFTLPTTKMLVYHYDVGAWSTRDFPAQYGGCLWRASYVGIDSDAGALRKEVEGQYHDANAAYIMAYTSAWIRPGALIQGGDRVKRLLFAGTWKDGHKSRVKWYFDYDDTVAATVNWTPTVSAATANYQFEARPSRQRVQAFKVRLEDVADGVDPLRDSFSLSELAVELAVRGHLADLPATGRAT